LGQALNASPSDQIERAGLFDNGFDDLGNLPQPVVAAVVPSIPLIVDIAHEHASSESCTTSAAFLLSILTRMRDARKAILRTGAADYMARAMTAVFAKPSRITIDDEVDEFGSGASAAAGGVAAMARSMSSVSIASAASELEETARLERRHEGDDMLGSDEWGISIVGSTPAESQHHLQEQARPPPGAAGIRAEDEEPIIDAVDEEEEELEGNSESKADTVRMFCLVALTSLGATRAFLARPHTRRHILRLFVQCPNPSPRLHWTRG